MTTSDDDNVEDSGHSTSFVIILSVCICLGSMLFGGLLSFSTFRYEVLLIFFIAYLLQWLLYSLLFICIHRYIHRKSLKKPLLDDTEYAKVRTHDEITSTPMIQEDRI